MNSAPGSFPAEVTDIRELAREGGRQVWLIALDRTPFAPGDSGGSIVATARSGASINIAVEAIERDSSGTVWHRTAKPLPAGTPVVCVVQGP